MDLEKEVKFRLVKRKDDILGIWGAGRKSEQIARKKLRLSLAGYRMGCGIRDWCLTGME